MTLDEKDLRLLRFFVYVVLGRWRDVAALRAAAPDGEPDRAWRETLLQVHLFAGFPRQVEAYEVLRRVGGLGPPDLDEHLDEPDLPDRGATLFDKIYGANSNAVQKRLRNHHPDFGAWIIGHAYGRVLSRPGLAPAQRELLAVGALAAFGQDRQLASHVRGAIHCGLSTAQLEHALEHIRDLLSEEQYERAQEILTRFGHAKPA